MKMPEMYDYAKLEEKHMNTIASENLLKAAELIATLAHKGQFDEAGVPYIEHPRFVAGLLPTTELKIIGFLHDVVEDTDVTLEDLRPIFGDEITDAIAAMTHDKSIPYSDYIEIIGKNALARKVKLADLTHNMDLSRIKEITDRIQKRYEKYQKAYAYLMAIESQKVTEKTK